MSWIKDLMLGAMRCHGGDETGEKYKAAMKGGDHEDDSSGGMPAGGEPFQQLVTGADGAPLWEDRLAYEQSAVVEIMPPTSVTNVFNSQKSVSCPHNGRIKIGDTGVLYIDGSPKPFTAIEKVYSGGPPVEVQLDVDGFSPSSGLIGLTSSNKLMFYMVALYPPGSTHTISLTHNATTTKTIDPKYIPADGGAIPRIESLDTENMTVLRDLDSGTYVLYGSFKPFTSSDSTMTFSSGLLVSLIRKDSETHIQVFYPVNNCVQHLKITDTDYTRTDVYLNDLAAAAANS